MRKQLKLLLLVATVLALFVMAMIVGSAAEVDVADETALKEAITNAQNGDVIKLTAPITLTEQLSISTGITLDGNGQTITLDASVTSGYMFNLSAADENMTITLKNFTADAKSLTSATEDSFIGFCGNGKFVFEQITAETSVQLISSSANDENNWYGYRMEITDCNLTTTSQGTNCILSTATTVNYNAAPEEGVEYVKVVLTNTTITTTTSRVFKIEGGTLILDSCTVNATKAACLYADSLTVNYIVKSESAPFRSVFNVAQLTDVRQNSSVTIGREGMNDDISVTAVKSYMFRFRGTSNGAAHITIHSGTFVCAENIYIANIKTGEGTGGFTVYNGTFIHTIIDTGTPKPIMFICEDYGDVLTLKNAVMLAPVDKQVTDGRALDANVQGVLYGGRAYKVYAVHEGDFVNSAEAGAGLYVESAVTGSGLRFETTIDRSYIDELLTKTGKTITDLKFYTLIAPTDYLAKANGVFTKAALDTALGVGNTNYIAIPAVYSLTGITEGVVTGDITYSGTLVSLRSYTRGYAAVSMIEYQDGANTVTLYGDFDSIDNARNAKQVAQNMVDDVTSEYNTVWVPATDPKAAVVDKYITGIVD